MKLNWTAIAIWALLLLAAAHEYRIYELRDAMAEQVKDTVNLQMDVIELETDRDHPKNKI